MNKALAHRGGEISPLAPHFSPFIDRVERAALTRANGDAVAILLRDTHNEHTRRNYRADLVDFFGANPPRESDVKLFLSLEPPDIVLVWDEYRNALLGKGLSPATINRRKAAVGALLKKAHRMGWSKTDGRGLLDGGKVEAGDTRGVDQHIFRKLPTAPRRRERVRESKTAELRDLRDEAILHVLCGRGLRRAEVCRLDVKDFSLADKTLAVQRKGKTQKRRLAISKRTADAIAEYLVASGHHADKEGPLFRNVNRNPLSHGGRLTPEYVLKMVKAAGRKFGLDDLEPHDLRRAAITALALKTNGNLVDVQEFSGHAKIETVRRYVRNALDAERRMVDLLDGVFDD